MFLGIFNPLVPELSGQYAMQKTHDLNGKTLFCIFLAYNVRCNVVICYLVALRTSTKLIFW
jgi:hypothetical protein